MKKKYTYVIIIFLIVASFIAFGRIVGNEFINFDDHELITENYHIQSGINIKSIKWAFSSTLYSYWHPLTWLSLTLDWSLFGANASGHHFISLLLHIGSVIFLFLFLNKTTNNIWPSAFAAAFFALHPLRVESVAWAAERKDVLSMFFGMATIYAYTFYSEVPEFSKYFLSLILFALALMSKPMIVTLPFVLMLLDYWPLKRWQKAFDKPSQKFYLIEKLIWEKVPFIVLTIAVSIVTLWAQNKEGSIASLDNVPFFTRVANTIVSYTAYIEKTFWPVNLAVFYPYNYSLPLWKILISGIIIIVITTVVIYFIKKLPFLFVGWFLYLGALIPVIGLVQVGSQAMADRYTYLPSIGIAIMLAWGMPLLFQKLEIRKKISFSVTIIVLCMIAVSTWMQCGYWKNSITLFNHALQVTKNNHLAHNVLGMALFTEGKIEEAIDHYNEVIHLKPNYYKETYSNRGVIYAKRGKYQQAIADFNKAIDLKHDYADAYNNRGITYDKIGQYQLAIEDLTKAIRLKQDYADAYNNRGITYFKQGNIKLCCDDLQKACDLGKCKTLKAAKNSGDCH